jgi:hypothetical protein
MRAQNAVDAAADAYALWQARGLNLAQALNNFHYDMLLAMLITYGVMSALSVVCFALQFIPYVGAALYQGCCVVPKLVMPAIDNAQPPISQAIMAAYPVIDYLFPITGVLRANEIAGANGADTIGSAFASTIEGLIDEISPQLGSQLGVLGQVGSFIDTVANTIGVDVYVFSLQPGEIWDLNIVEKGSGDSYRKGDSTESDDGQKPMHPPWRTTEIMTVMNAIAVAMCSVSQCSDDCGWEETYWYGYPGFTTWIAGKDRHNFVGGFENNPWLNPAATLVPTFTEDDSKVFQDTKDAWDVFEHRDSSPNEFRNPGFIALASSQPIPHENHKKHPLVERSKGWDAGDWAHPYLISVHFTSTNGWTARDFFIWH